MKRGREGTGRTLFPDQTVVAIVGVVGITQPSMTVFEFEEFVAVFSGMTSAGGGESEKRLTDSRPQTCLLVSLHGGQKNQE